MKESNLRKVQVAASFALILAAPVVTKAANYSFEADSGALRVSYSDLDLSIDEGVAVLYSRLQSASREACDVGNYQKNASVKATLSANACYTDVLSKVVAKVGSDKLTAIHES